MHWHSRKAAPAAEDRWSSVFSRSAVPALMLALSLLGSPAGAHGWYPHACCHDQDCGPVTALEYLRDGGMKVTTSIGTAVVPKGYTIQPSLDGKAHACIRQIGPDEEHFGFMVVCLFLPSSV